MTTDLHTHNPEGAAVGPVELQPSLKSNWREAVVPAVIGFLAIALIALGLAVAGQGSRIKGLTDATRDVQIAQYETRARVYELRAASLRTYLQACRDAESRQSPHDDCTRVEADWTNALAEAKVANEEAVKLRTQLEGDTE